MPTALRALADYTMRRHYPEVVGCSAAVLAFFDAVVERQAALIAQWQLVGFIHGVMNTDNMSLAGETIDYGPCAFMDRYDPATVFSSIDEGGRYAYANQPPIAQWNLARLAEALLHAVRRRPGARRSSWPTRRSLASRTASSTTIWPGCAPSSGCSRPTTATPTSPTRS